MQITTRATELSNFTFSVKLVLKQTIIHTNICVNFNSLLPYLWLFTGKPARSHKKPGAAPQQITARCESFVPKVATNSPCETTKLPSCDPNTLYQGQTSNTTVCNIHQNAVSLSEVDSRWQIHQETLPIITPMTARQLLRSDVDLLFFE